MKTLLALFMLMSMTAYAQRVEIPFAFTNTVGDQSKTYGVTVAAHPDGTDELDTALGEKEIPSLPPPAGVFIVYSIPPSKDYIWLSPVDVRKLEVGKQHRVEYTIGATWNAGRLDVSWGPIPNLIDSAYLVDVVSDFPDNFIKVKIEPGKTYSTINTAITKLKVLVWYNGTSLSVDENLSPVKIYPNPSTEEFVIEGAKQSSVFDIVDASGAVIFTGTIDHQQHIVSMPQLSPGLYVLRLQNGDGTVHITKLLRR